MKNNRSTRSARPSAKNIHISQGGKDLTAQAGLISVVKIFRNYMKRKACYSCMTFKFLLTTTKPREISAPCVAKSIHSKRSIVNAILYVLKTACQWSMLGHDLPPWQSVCDHDRRWKKRWTVERTFAFWLMPKMDRNISFYS